MSNRSRTLVGLALTSMIAATLTACSGSSSDDGRPGTVTPAESSGGSDGWDGNIAIGVGNRKGVDLVTLPAPDQVDVQCHGEGDNLTVDITAPNGWHATLTHGSQTITVENETLNYPAHDFAESPGAIEAVNRTRPKGSTKQYPLGVTWDKPSVGEVEIQVDADTPPHWMVNSPYEDFDMYMHNSCGLK